MNSSSRWQFKSPDSSSDKLQTRCSNSNVIKYMVPKLKGKQDGPPFTLQRSWINPLPYDGITRCRRSDHEKAFGVVIWFYTMWDFLESK